MKKLFLSLAAVAMTAAVANATETTLDLLKVSTDDIDGTYVAAAGNTGEHYDLEALQLDGYVFTFSKTTTKQTTPTFYPTASASTIRIYAGSIMTIVAPQGTNMGTITMTLSTAAKGVDANNNITATNGVVTVNGSTITWNGTEAVNAVTFTVPSNKGADGNNPNIRIKSLVVNTEVTDAPEPPAPVANYEWNKAGMPESGAKYVMVANDKLATAIEQTATYGRYTLTTATIADGKVATAETNGILFENTEKGWTLKDGYGRYLSMDEGHYTTFQLFTEINEGSYWTITEEADGIKIANALYPTCFVCVSQGEDGKWYTNVAPAQAPEKFLLPTLYKQGDEAGEVIPAGSAKFAKADNVRNGKMIFVVDGMVATPIGEKFTYGYMQLVKASIKGKEVTCSEDYAVTVEGDASKFTMKDVYGRYVGQDASHTSSFQLYTELGEGCYWSATVEADGVKIVNELQPESFICRSKDKNGEWYSTLAPAKTSEFMLPAVYMIEDADVEVIETVDADAPVYYFDLQGRRVANPEKGLFIRVQGSKATKVVIR